METTIDIQTEFGTLRELKDFLNKLPDEKLDKKLVSMRDNSGLILYEENGKEAVLYM